MAIFAPWTAQILTRFHVCLLPGHVGTNLQIADALTKPLSESLFTKFRDRMLGLLDDATFDM